MAAETVLSAQTSEIVAPQPSSLKTFWLNFSESSGAVVALLVLLSIAFVAIFANEIAPYNYAEQFRDAIKVPPVWSEGGSWRFPFGTDDVGRDTLSRLIFGARISLFIGLCVMSVSCVVGVFLGLGAVFWGSVADVVITRLMDLITAVPSLVMAILIVAALGPNLTDTIIAVTIVYMPRYVRLVRAAALAEMPKDYVTAARVSGVKGARLMFVTVLPNCLSPLIVQAALGASDAILEAAGLGFLGLGAQPPLSEWGTMLADVKNFIRSDPWLVALPGLAILVTLVAINIVGDGLRDALDPKMRRS